MQQEMEKEWNNEHGMNRRRFLRQAVLAGSTFCVASTTGKAVGSEPAVMNISGRPYTGLAGMAAVHNRRTLGSGTAAMNVSAMGFGCMGLNHHRSQHPGKEQAIALIREAIERGVTLFDTAESYGYHKNEKLMGGGFERL